MKFNKQELLNLACQSSNSFVKEGCLQVFERQDGILKRNESKNKSCLFHYFSFWGMGNCLLAYF
jgi:hypothetical protein